MRSEKEIDDMIAKLSAAESPSVAAAIMALMGVRWDEVGAMLQLAIEKSITAVRGDINPSEWALGLAYGFRPLTVRLEPITDPTPAPHGPATPPQEG